MPGITSNVIKAGVQLSLLDKLTPEMRRTLATNKTLLNSFAQATNQQNMFGPMAQANLAQYERGMARIAASQKLMQTGMIGLGASVAAQLYAGNAFVKFEDDMAYIDTILDGKIKAIDRFGKDVLRISRTTGNEIADVSRGAYQALSSNVPQEYLMKFTEQMSKVAIAGRTSVENSTKSTLAVLNAYGMPANEQNARRVNDMLFETVNRGIIEYNELSGVLSEFTASGAMANSKIEEMLAALATLTLSGKSGSESGTQLNRFVLSVIGASDEVKNFAKTLGIDFNISHMKEIGFLKFIEEIDKGIGDNEEALNKLFPEVRAFTMVAPLIGSMKETFLDISQSIITSEGKAEEAFTKMTDTTKHKMDIIKQSFESIKISVGEIFAEEYGPGLENFAGYLSDIAENENAMKDIAGTIKGLGWAGGTLGAIGLLGKGVGAIDIGVAGFKTALSTGKLVANGGGLAFLGSGLGKLTGLFGGGSAAASGTTAAISGGWAGYGAPLGASAMPATGATIGTGSLFGPLSILAIVTALTAGIDAHFRRKEINLTNDKLQKIVDAILEFKETNNEALKNLARENGFTMDEVWKYHFKQTLPENLLNDIRRFNEDTRKTQKDLFQIFGGGKDFFGRTIGQKRDLFITPEILDYSKTLRKAYSAESDALERGYYDQALEYFGDPEIARAIMPFIAAGLMPNLLDEFSSTWMKQQDTLRQKSFLSQAAEISNIGIVREMEKISSKNLLSNPLYQPSLSARYQYDPGIVLKEKLLTFEEMFEKKPEKDDWQIVVNINGQETYAELRKNGTSVKSIDSIVNDFKVKNSFRRNPAYIEKPR